MKLLFTGDLCPIGVNIATLSRKGGIREGIKEFFSSYDFVMSNLESPLYDGNSPISKYGPNLKAPTSVAYGIKDMGIRCVTLANNHIRDHGDAGIISTLNILDQVDIKYFGGGVNSIDAGKGYCLHRDNGGDICFLAYAEQEFNVASVNRAGANPLNIPQLVRDLCSLPSEAFKIVIIHGGNEHLSVPHPQLRDICRLSVELGADIVVCHHSHCIGAFEKYLNGEIYYSLGNFLFDRLPQKHRWIKFSRSSDRDSWSNGILLSVEIGMGKHFSSEVIPFVQDKSGGLFHIANGDMKFEILNQFESCNNCLADEELYRKEWRRHCLQHKNIYDGLLIGGSRLLYILSKIGVNPVNLLQTNWGRRNIGLVQRCLAHSEVIKSLYSDEN